MIHKHVFLAPVCLSLATAVWSPAAEEFPTEDRMIENLAAVTRVYGYVRFFHPSDQAAAVDWDKVGVLGAEVVRSAGDGEALRAALLRVFQPIAPRLRLTNDAASAVLAEPQAADAKQTFWQYVGIGLTDQRGVYRQLSGAAWAAAQSFYLVPVLIEISFGFFPRGEVPGETILTGPAIACPEFAVRR